MFKQFHHSELNRYLLPLQNWIGEVKSKDNTHFTILNLNETVIPGPPLSIRIFVKFREGENVPRLRSIHINGRQICPTDHGIIFMLFDYNDDEDDEDEDEDEDIDDDDDDYDYDDDDDDDDNINSSNNNNNNTF
jgi:hypothetical protein